MAGWNLNPAWTELQDIVREQVTSTTGITDEMFNSLMENVQYCKNNLGMSDVRVGSVITNTLEPGNLASVSCTERLVDNYTYLDFVFNIPRGKDGMGTYINGEPTPVYFTSDPQSQINDLKQQSTNQSEQIKTLGQVDQNLQTQINDLKSASNFTSLWSGNWTNANTNAKSINFSGYKYIMVRGNVGQPFCVMMAVADLTYGFTVYSPGNSNTIFAFSLKVTQNSIAWGNAGTYSNGVFQDRTNTGYYNIWEILGVK